MKTLYLDCCMGAAGDMLMGALLELLPDRENFLEELNAAGIPDVEVQAEQSIKCGIVGTHICVRIHGAEEHSEDIHNHSHAHHQEHAHEDSKTSHSHAGLDDIFRIIDSLHTEPEIKKDVKNIYTLIAEAESQVHGKTVSDIHFHEVGTADAIADITGCVMLLHRLAVQRIIASPVSTGYGQVRCAHGILPVPAPATAQLLRGIPCRAGDIQGELCTPTGAALIKYFASEFGYMPEMVMEKVGYGMGAKDYPAANCIRAILGEG